MTTNIDALLAQNTHRRGAMDDHLLLTEEHLGEIEKLAERSVSELYCGEYSLDASQNLAELETPAMIHDLRVLRWRVSELGAQLVAHEGVVEAAMAQRVAGRRLRAGAGMSAVKALLAADSATSAALAALEGEE